MTHVYIIERVYDYEGSELIGVCIDDLELAKRLAQSDSEDMKDETTLDWYKSPHGEYVLADVDGSRRYAVLRCEVTEQ